MSDYAHKDDGKPSPSTAAPSPTDTASSAPRSNKRRRGSTSGSRGVANLTPDQLAKKRANDREAQRAIRERTKTQIETLERTIRELTSQQPYQELRQVLQQKEAVEAENRDIKRRLSAVLELIKPLLNSQVTGDLNVSPYSNTAIPSSAASPATDTNTHNGNFTPSPNLSYPKVYPTHTHPSASSMPTIPLQPSWQAAIVPISSLTSPSAYVFAPHNPNERHRDISGHEPTQGAIAERSGFGFFGNEDQELSFIGQTPELRQPLPADSHITLTMSRPQAPIQAYRNPILGDISLAPKSATIKNVPSTCPLDDLLLGFIAEQKLRATEGVPICELAGPADPDVSCLLRPERIPYSHPVSRIMIDILGKFPSLSSLPEQIASLYVMHAVLRWQVAPTQENYDRLPEWMRPTPLQYSVPHPAWMDYLPWPRMRDIIMSSYDSYPFDNWFIPYTTSVSLNWPYEDSDTILSHPGSDEMSINPLYEQHLRKMNNWSLGLAFAQAHPELAECVRIEAHPRRKIG